MGILVKGLIAVPVFLFVLALILFYLVALVFLSIAELGEEALARVKH